MLRPNHSSCKWKVWTVDGQKEGEGKEGGGGHKSKSYLTLKCDGAGPARRAETGFCFCFFHGSKIPLRGCSRWTVFGTLLLLQPQMRGLPLMAAAYSRCIAKEMINLLLLFAPEKPHCLWLLQSVCFTGMILDIGLLFAGAPAPRCHPHGTALPLASHCRHLSTAYSNCKDSAEGLIA